MRVGAHERTGVSGEVTKPPAVPEELPGQRMQPYLPRWCDDGQRVGVRQTAQHRASGVRQLGDLPVPDSHRDQSGGFRRNGTDHCHFRGAEAPSF